VGSLRTNEVVWRAVRREAERAKARSAPRSEPRGRWVVGAHRVPLLRGAAVRELDVARAAWGAKLAFLSGECGLFFYFWVGGEVRGEGFVTLILIFRLFGAARAIRIPGDEVQGGALKYRAFSPQ
jgi:hypothetical protein